MICEVSRRNLGISMLLFSDLEFCSEIIKISAWKNKIKSMPENRIILSLIASSSGHVFTYLDFLYKSRKEKRLNVADNVRFLKVLLALFNVSLSNTLRIPES